MANIIVAYRKMVANSQEEMANYLGISTITYGKKERGLSEFKKNEMVRFTNLIKTVKPDITIEEIFFNEEYQKI